MNDSASGQPLEESQRPPAIAPSRATSFRDRVMSNPGVVVLGIVVGAISATLGLALPAAQLIRENEVAAVHKELADERSLHQSEVTSLQQSLSSIRLSLGSDTDYLDVGKIVINRDQANEIQATAVLFPDDGFYALDTRQATAWTHFESTELHLLAGIAGLTDDEFVKEAKVTSEVRTLLTKFPLDVWRTGPDRVISLKDPSSGMTTALHLPTQVIVQRVAHDDLEATLVALMGKDANPENVRRLYRLDPTGGILQRELLLQMADGGELPLIDSLQKKGPTAYAKLETVLFDATVDGQSFDRYYFDRDVLIVSTDSDAFVIKRILADDDHRTPDIATLNQWLQLFRVCRDC